MKKAIQILIYWMVGCAVFAQCPPAGNMFLCSQLEVDNFAANYPDCTRISGSLFIQNMMSTNTNISDLTPLSGLEVIEESLIIDRNPLTTLTGLDNIDSVGLDVIITKNQSLQSLTGLESLSRVHQTLSIAECDQLQTLTGLDGITEVYNLFITLNNQLDSLNGLEQLVRVENEIRIDRGGIKSLTGLQNLQSAGHMELDLLPALKDFTVLANLDTLQSLTISDVDKPTDLQGFENITSLNSLSITGNLRIQHLDALDNITILAGTIHIADNGNLTSIEGLSGAKPDSIISLNIIDNPKLAVCHIESVCTYLSIGGENTISNNKAGCTNTAEVLDACVVSVENTDHSAHNYIFPNPSKGIFQVNGIPQGAYQIHDTAGRIIQSGNMENDLSIDISKEAKGVYFISIQLDNEVITKRIIKL